MEKTLIVDRVDGISTNANNLYKFISILVHSASSSSICFKARDSSLFCELFNCTDTEYLNAFQELVCRDIIAEDFDGSIILHPNLLIFAEDFDY